MNLNPEKKMVLEWKGDYKLEARNEKGISVKYDATIEYGGAETALITNGECFGKFSARISYDVLIIVKKKRQKNH